MGSRSPRHGESRRSLGAFALCLKQYLSIAQRAGGLSLEQGLPQALCPGLIPLAQTHRTHAVIGSPSLSIAAVPGPPLRAPRGFTQRHTRTSCVTRVPLTSARLQYLESIQRAATLHIKQGLRQEQILSLKARKYAAFSLVFKGNM